MKSFVLTFHSQPSPSNPTQPYYRPLKHCWDLVKGPFIVCHGSVLTQWTSAAIECLQFHRRLYLVAALQAALQMLGGRMGKSAVVILPSPIPSLHVTPGQSCSMCGVAMTPCDSLGVGHLCLKEGERDRAGLRLFTPHCPRR